MISHAGTVIIASDGTVCLRMPTGHFGGYVWTFAKGRREDGETPEQAAGRETFEETGWTVNVGAAIGDFAGDTSTTRFFLATVIEYHGKPDTAETSAVMWVSRERAAQMIGKSTTEAGKARDLAVLAAAFELRDAERRSIV